MIEKKSQKSRFFFFLFFFLFFFFFSEDENEMLKTVQAAQKCFIFILLFFDLCFSILFYLFFNFILLFFLFKWESQNKSLLVFSKAQLETEVVAEDPCPLGLAPKNCSCFLLQNRTAFGVLPCCVIFGNVPMAGRSVRFRKAPKDKKFFENAFPKLNKSHATLGRLQIVALIWVPQRGENRTSCPSKNT